jgi:hypothetical protein
MPLSAHICLEAIQSLSKHNDDIRYHLEHILAIKNHYFIDVPTS